MPYFLQASNFLFFFIILGIHHQGIGQSFKLTPLDNNVLLKQELSNRKPGRSPAFAVKREVEITPFSFGQWKALNREEESWKLEILSPNALSVNLGFTEFYLPKNARLYLSGGNNAKRLGPFAISDNEFHQEFWTPAIEGESILIELIVPKSQKKDVVLKITSVNHDFAGFYSILSGECNIDVVCEEGIPFQDISRSVAIYGIQGTNFCTGFLINNTAQDCRPFFMTANHCGITGQSAPSVVVYWNYQNSYCRTGSEENQEKGDGQLLEFNSGAILRANYPPSDFTLLELDDPAPVNSFFAGWDISNQSAKNTTICIHHPSTSEKRISLNYDGTEIINYQFGDQLDPNGQHLMVENWELGTTESGSSGAPLFNENKRVVGQLHGGLASCSENLYDAFGWIYKSWTGGGSPQNRLKDWLDPLNLNLSFIDGKEESNCGYNYILSESVLNICGDSTFIIELELTSRFTGRVSFSLSGLPEGYNYSLNPQFGTPGQKIKILLTPPKNNISHLFNLIVSASDGTKTGYVTIKINQFDEFPNTPEPTILIPGLNPLIKWPLSAKASDYQLQVFNSDYILQDTIVTDTLFRIPNLKPREDYLWRLRSLNFCGFGPWSSSQIIETPSIYCQNKTSIYNSLSIPDDRDQVLRDTIFIEENGFLEMISQVAIEIEHSYIGDLSAQLISPKGKIIPLFNQPGLFTEGYGCPGENLSVIFSDSAQNPHLIFENTCEFSAIAISGSFQPMEKLAQFAGDSIKGPWILEIKDNAEGDEGKLLEWSLTFCTTFPIRKIELTIFPDELKICEEDEIDFLISSNTDLTLLPGLNFLENQNEFLNLNEFSPGSSKKEAMLRITGFEGLPTGTFEFNLAIPNIYPLNVLSVFGEKQELPEKPVPIQEDYTGSSPLFRWTNSTNAKTYRLEVSPDSFFSELLLKVNTSDTFFNPGNIWEEGRYYWKIIALNDCGSTSSNPSFFNISRPNSLNFQENLTIKIFPNPVEDWLYLTTSKPLENGVIHIFGIQGILLKKYELSPSTDYFKINLYDWPQGIYGMVIQSEEGIWHRKIVIHR